MSTWTHRIDLNSLFDDDIPDPMDDHEGFNRIKGEVVARLEVSRLFPAPYVAKVRNARSLTGFRKALNLVYDYADANGIWMGL
jgi:hypothetical protein